jgi:hypothetical protein
MGRLDPRSGKGEEHAALGIVPLLQQSEDQFFYAVIARALDRSADANRFIDTLLFTLMAAQTAIYAISLDKIKECSELLLGGFIAAVLGAALTLFVREGPVARAFAVDFPDDPQETRYLCIERYVAKAKTNERIRAAKMIILGLSIAVTIISLWIATWHARSA